MDGHLHGGHPTAEIFDTIRPSLRKIRAMSSSAAVSRGSRAPKPSRVRVPEKFADAEKLYGIENWGKGFFSVSDDGNLLVHPTRENHRFVDLKGVIDDVALRGISTPVVDPLPADPRRRPSRS